MKLDAKKFRVSTHYWSKREFNPQSKEDISEYRHFLQNGNWRNGCPFHIEWPYTSIPHMIESKFIRQHLLKPAR